MKTSDLFRQLSFGELSNLSISDSGSGEITPDKQPQLIQYTNDALVMLFSRFVLIEKDVTIQQVEGLTDYFLQRKFAVTSGSAEAHHYIKDEEDPFLDDVIRVLALYHVSGQQYPLNDSDKFDSLFTPRPLMIQVPMPIAGQPIAVVYQARHPQLNDVTGGDADILEQEIEIPYILENVLKLYVAYKVFSHMNGQENIIKGQEYRSTYEAACLEIEQRDLVNQTSTTSHRKLEQRGFI